MKILAFSDLHRDEAVANTIVQLSDQADVIVGAGDFATMGLGITDTITVLRRITTQVVLVSGNHESLDALRTACAGWSAAHVLHGETITIGGIAFFGLGFEISTVARGPWNSQMSEAKAAMALSKCPANAVLVTHAPPFGIADQQADGTHDGSHAIRTAIEQLQPKLTLCGHIHHSWGRSGFIGTCPVHNLGPKPQWFNV